MKARKLSPKATGCKIPVLTPTRDRGTKAQLPPTESQPIRQHKQLGGVDL